MGKLPAGLKVRKGHVTFNIVGRRKGLLSGRVFEVANAVTR